MKKHRDPVANDQKPSPPVKAQKDVKDQKSTKKEPRGIKAWLIRIINRAIGRLSKFN